MLRRRIEEASLNAWPALQQMLFGGWILRFSKGYTKRANSVNPLFASSIDVREKIETCETLYAEKGLPPIFRITPFASPADLDRVLESRGYKQLDTTLVLHLGLSQGTTFPPPPPGRLREEPLDDWLELYGRLSSSPLDGHQAHREILQTIPSRRYLAALRVSDQVVSCAMGVLDRGFFGIFDVVTDPQHRNKGYGTELVHAMLGWAQANGAMHAYLQVVSGNAPARHLYDKLGFREIYRYRYRIPR
jgi:GNAT superfamily N-acetyltransferase